MGRNIRVRALMVGIVFGLLICLATPYHNIYLMGTLLGGGHFPLAPFFIFAWLMVLIAATARILRRPPLLTGLELLCSWAIMVVVSGIPYTGLLRTFLVNITSPFQFATTGNRWDEVLHPIMPKELYPQDPAAVETLWNGLDRAYDMGWWEILSNIPWQAWITPLSWWAVFILLSYLTMLCTVNILSRQWIANERMNFPLLRLPQFMEEVMDQQRLGNFLTDRYLVLGLLVPAILHTINGLNFYHPQVPAIPTLIPVGPYFPPTGLFAGFNKLRIYFYPAFIGFAFLAARQISLSFWFFYLFGSFIFGILALIGLSVPPAALGVSFGPTLAFPEETQMIGACVVFFLFILWLARFHLAQVLKAAFIPGGEPPRETEWLSLRWSFWGLMLGGFGLVAWCVYFGMSLPMALLVLLAFYMMTVVATRVICQGGIPYFTLTAAPLDAILAFMGSKLFTAQGLLLAAVSQKVLYADLRESLMPSLLHASKVSEQTSRKRLMLLGIVLIILLGLVASFAAMLVLAHRYGMRELNLEWATTTTVSVYENVQRLLEVPSDARPFVMLFAAIGAAVMLGLIVCYQRFYWWPLHPIGYLATYSSAMRILWFSFFIGWAVNELVLRYGGMGLHRRVRLFFFGLILGDFLMGGIFASLGVWTGSSYMTMPD